MPQGQVAPTTLAPGNQILYGGEPIVEEMEVLTTTQFCPGKLVIYDTTLYQCKAAGNEAVDVIGVADVPSDQKLTLYYTPSAGGAVTKAFTVKDQIRVLRGPIIVKCILLSGETVTKGERLVAAANGMVKAFAAHSAEKVIGYTETTPADADKCSWILVKLTI